MLTKDEISDTLEVCAELKERDQNFVTSPDYIEDLCRLALLGLEREESRARVAAGIDAETHVESSVLADAFGAFPDLEPEPERDERAERVGRAVLACMDEEQLRANDLRKFDSFDDTDGYSIDVPKYDVSGLLAAIADAMEEP